MNCLLTDNTGQSPERLQARVVGEVLGAFKYGVLGQLFGEEEADSGLDLSGCQGVLLVLTNKLAGLGGGLVEQVFDEGVHHGHAVGGDAGVGVYGRML